jgi:hypothetical protein
MLQALREELVGPAPAGQELDCSRPVRFDDAKQAFKPWRQQGTGEEILQRDPPTQRYGVGVLYPVGTRVIDTMHDEDTAPSGLLPQEDPSLPGDGTISVLTEAAAQAIEKIERGRSTANDDADPGDFDLSTSNAFRPGSMGVSFLAEFPRDSKLVVEATGGRYTAIDVAVGGQSRTWWLRTPVTLRAEFTAAAICTPRSAEIQPSAPVQVDGLDLDIEVYSRPRDENQRLVTVCLVNRSKAGSLADGKCLFQAGLKAWVEAADGSLHILPYPGARAANPDLEEQSLALLYRNEQTFATGHGCAAGWDTVTQAGRATWVSAECLPVFETPSTTPDVTREDSTLLQVPMAALAGLIPGNDGFGAVTEVVERYEHWVREKEREIPSLEARYQEAARVDMRECARCAERMRKGLDYLKSDALTRRAFQLANYAILIQQAHSRREPRHAQFDEKELRVSFPAAYQPPDLHDPPAGRGMWRAFQIAFLLMSVQSAVDPDLPERETVELIWFPTGGGKTEAYLGLAAFALFMRRLCDRDDAGVHVLMRYTLRLLTAQQFQRASGLICAMEFLRRRHASELGTAPFSIGIWVGGDNTPNTRKQALEVLNGLNGNNRGVKNQFILARCPWCGAQMGPVDFKVRGSAAKRSPRVLGYYREGETVVFRCPDKKACEFADSLPIYVIDEDIYDKRPSLVIGTVDKFAMLAWRPEARAIFGIGPDGERNYSPPGLIIQDELHLISGPLGSMVGLYEGVIEELCTDRRRTRPVVPKIVSSTATIRRYREQIKALYARTDVTLFPPPGLEAGDSFFARYARRPDGSLEHGRMYVGVHGPGLGSTQTAEVRAFTALLQAPVSLPDAERNPWWTLLVFFNSLRELGTTLSLFQSNIPDYFRVLKNRSGLDFDAMRRYYEVQELTGRLPSDEVPAAIAALEVSCTSTSGSKPVDVCLASNILEVGVDIDRLSLMAVVGQPKTTAQYIQVTGRVGRQWKDRPGLIVTLYGAAKPRDRSHFEKFRSYHERLYAQVEPTSVTPFSPPALDRALHAVMVAYARQAGTQSEAQSPFPYPEQRIERLKNVLLPRVREVDPAEVAHFVEVFTARADQWRLGQRSQWTTSDSDPDIPLLRAAGAYADAEQARLAWPTPQSMRTVDAECLAKITTLYLQVGANHE